MELKKENIHRIGGVMSGAMACRTNSFTLDDDFNVPDAKPDVKQVLRENGRIRVLEKKCNAGRLHIRGVLLADVLYISEDGTGIYGMESELPFDEMIHMEQEDCSGVTVRAELEDITATMIHSRKLNVKALITVQISCEEIEDEIVVTEAEGNLVLNADGTEKQQQVYGVYCMWGNTARFKKVNILWQEDEYMIVESAQADDPLRRLRAGDQVITAAEDLYDGKVIE